MNNILKKLNKIGQWSLCNTSKDCSLGKYVATMDVIIGYQHKRYHYYGDAIEETLQGLLSEIPENN